MSEYLSKKAVLEYTKQNAAIFFDLESYHDFRNAVLSGAFDVDQTEIQRLRAALMEIKQLLNENRENDGAFQSWNHMQAWKVAAQALSTTIEPTNATTKVTTNG